MRADARSAIDRRQFLARGAGTFASVGVAGTLLSACGDDEGDAFADSKPPSRPAGAFRRAGLLEVDTLDPATSLSAGIVPIYAMYEGLARFNGDYTELVPELATSWQESEDGREWEFALRRGVKFHDDEPLDAESVKATFEYFKKKEGLAGTLVPEFDEVDVSDPLKIRFVLSNPYGDMLRNQAFLRIMSAKAIRDGTRAIESRPAGTGPYRFVDRKKGRSLTMEANTDYWGKGPYFRSFELPTITDPSARVNALQSRQIDQIPAIDPSAALRLEANSRFEVPSTSSWRVDYLHFPVDRENVSDHRVRQAVAYALDRPAIVKSVLRGRAAVADSVMPPDTYGKIRPELQYSQDLERSRELLRAAGSGPGHKIQMAVAKEFGQQDTAQAMVAQLQEAGFDASLELIDDTILLADLSSGKEPKRDVYVNGHTWINGGPLIFTIELIQQLSHFNPPHFKKLNERQKTLPDGTEREAAIGEMQRIVQEQAPYIALWVPQQMVGQQAEIQGYQPSKDGLTSGFAGIYRAQ